MSDLNSSPKFRQTWPRDHKEESHEEQKVLDGISGFDTFWYNAQLRKYIVQMAAIFAGIKIRVGWRDDNQPRLAPVPIKNASKDRVVAAIKGENTQNVPIRLPMMSLQLTNIELAPEMRHGVAQQRRDTFMPAGGKFPDDIRVVDQRMPVPYKGMFEVSIWTSNQDQHYQIVEQMLTLFDPTLQIQRSDEPFDWTKLAYVEMTGVNFEENVPAGTEKRTIETTFQFSTNIYLEVPNVVHDKFVKEIYVRIGTVGIDVDSSYDIISDLDSQGFEYEKWYDLDYADIGEEGEK
jgi:hypothetical protein